MISNFNREPLFSIVIPLYNKELYIGRAISSILNQTIQDFEIIVINDGSTDQSEYVVKNFLDKRIILVNQINAGESAARNAGIKISKSNYVTFLDADDAYLPFFLETVLKLREKYPWAGAFGTAYGMQKTDNILHQPKYYGIPAKRWDGIVSDYFLSIAFGDLILTSSSICIKKEVFDEVGYFPLGVKLAPDQDMWARLALKYPVAFDNKICAIYFQNSTNRICNTEYINGELKHTETLQNALDDRRVPDHLVNGVKKYIAKQLILGAADNIKRKNRHLGRKMLYDSRTRIFARLRLFWLVISYFPSFLIFFLVKARYFLYALKSKLKLN